MDIEERGSRSHRHKSDKHRDRGKKEKKSKKARSISSSSSSSRSRSRSRSRSSSRSSSPQPRKKVKKTSSPDKKRGGPPEEEPKLQKNYSGSEENLSGPRMNKPGAFNPQPGGRPGGKNFGPMMYPPQKGMMNMNPMMMNMGMGMGMGMHPMGGMMGPPGAMPGMRGPMGEMMDPNMWGMNPYYAQRMPGGMMPGPMHMQMPMQMKRPEQPGPLMDKKADKPEKAKEIAKEPKKETKFLELLHLPTTAQMLQSLQFSVKNAQGVLTTNTIKKTLKELADKCTDKRLKVTAKEIIDFLTEYDTKPGKEERDHKTSHHHHHHHHANVLSELEFIEAMSKAEDLATFFKVVDLKNFSDITSGFPQEYAEKNMEEEDAEYEDARDLFLSNVPKSHF